MFKNLTEGLVSSGHNVTVVTHKIKGTESFEIINGVKIHRVNSFQSRYLFTFFSIPKVMKLSKSSDIIHATTFNAAFPAWLASTMSKKIAVLSVLEVWVGKWRIFTDMGLFNSIIHDFLERSIYLLKFDKYICISKSTQNQLVNIGIEKSKSSVIYCGIDYALWNPRKYSSVKLIKKLNLQNNYIYLFYGRPGISKGLQYLIQAVPKIHKEIPNSKLIAIVSRDKSYRKLYDSIIKMVKELCVEDYVKIINPVQYLELPKYIKAADCVVVPSLTEGFGFTAAESCAMNVPIVASNVSSIPEVVSGRYILVNPRSSEEIADGVISCYKKKYLIAHPKKFSWDSSVKSYLKIYEGLVNENT